MKNIVIIGAGGFGREVQWLIERINSMNKIWNILGYVDDGIEKDSMIHGYPVIGGIDYLETDRKTINVVCAIASPKIRKKIIKRLEIQQHILFPNLIDPTAILSERAFLGKGNIICARCMVSVDVHMNDFNIIDMNSVLGHDITMGSFITVYPSVNVSGNVQIGSEAELGTGTQIIQGKKIGGEVILGAGAVVVKDIAAKCVAVGCPAKSIKYLE